jgi:hypothetical protein
MDSALTGGTDGCGGLPAKDKANKQRVEISTNTNKVERLYGMSTIFVHGKILGR